MSFERWQDLRPAFFCSEAVLVDKNADVEKFLNKARDEYSMELPFDKVHVSVDHEDDPRSVKFLVAYGPEATFIAFRGARDFGYLGRDKEKLPTSKDLHATVSELAASFLGPDFKLLEGLYRSGKRIIFCGHRLGGAVAQMVTMKFWKTDEIDKSTISEENPDPIIAISFGAPQIWDDLHVQDFIANPHLKRRFLNLSSNEDPLRSIPKSGLQAPHPNPESPTFGTQVSAGSRAQGSGTKNYLPSKIWPWKESKPESKFIKCYKSAVEDVLALEKYSGPNVRADQPLPEIVVLSSAPKVELAYRKATDSGSFIIISGSNLLFLREKVKLDGLYPWDTKVQTDEQLIIFSPEKTKPEDINNSISKVVIKTAFGGTSHDVSEGNTEEPLRLLSRIVQTYYILTTPGPFCCPPSDMDEVLAVLDGIVQCVPDSIKDDEKTISTLFREGANIEEMNALVQKVTKFLDTSYEIQYNKNKYVIMGLVFGGALLAAGLVMIPVGGAALAVAGAATIGAVGLTSAGAAAAVGGTGVVAIFLSPKKLMLEKYSDMLKLAIHEASLWNNSTSNLALKPLSPKTSEKPLTLTELEFLLQQEVKHSGSEFDRLKKQVYNPKARDTSFQSHGSNLIDATLESKQNFLKRMDIVAKTVDLYNKKVKNIIEFLGLVGEEDSGKSTFIKNAIKSVGAKQHSDVPQVGMDYHTEIVKPYKLQDQFYLVDFPGSNGVEKYANAWVQFTALPSSCILLLQFKGDIKLEQVQIFKRMQKDLDSKIAVVFNKVDLLYTPKAEKVYTAQYFKSHREKSAEKLGCAEKDVYYVCLDPDPQERLTKLRKVGVLGFEELVYKLGKWLGQHSYSKSHQVLLGLRKVAKDEGDY